MRDIKIIFKMHHVETILQQTHHVAPIRRCDDATMRRYDDSTSLEILKNMREIVAQCYFILFPKSALLSSLFDTVNTDDTADDNS
jgi:hypothetical protein